MSRSFFAPSNSLHRREVYRKLSDMKGAGESEIQEVHPGGVNGVDLDCLQRFFGGKAAEVSKGFVDLEYLGGWLFQKGLFGGRVEGGEKSVK